MDPFGHPHHHHHNRRNSDEDEQPRPPFFGAPPPPLFTQPPSAYPPNDFSGPPRPPFPLFQDPPPPHQHHHHHSSHEPDFNYPQPPPPNTQVTHVTHHDEQPPHHSPSTPPVSNLSNKPTFKVYCKAQPDFSLTVRNHKVVLAPSNPSDEFQHWYKDEKYSTRVKDEEGFPSFALVNKATGLAMKHAVGDTQPVELVPYNPDTFDQSVLWTESRDTGEGFRTIRMVSNIRLNVDAFNGDKKHGGVRDGTTIVLWQWKKGENQRWKIVPYCKSLTNITQETKHKHTIPYTQLLNNIYSLSSLAFICRKTGYCYLLKPVLCLGSA